MLDMGFEPQILKIVEQWYWFCRAADPVCGNRF
jgi:hypothetical protein